MRLPGLLRRRTVSGPSSLLTNLAAYWKLDEAAGATRADSTANANDLADHAGNVGQAAGKVGNAASFTNTSGQYLFRASNATLQMGTGVRFTLAFWAKFNSIGVLAPLTKWGDTGGEYAVYTGLAGNVFTFTVNGDTKRVNSSVTLSTGTWYFVAAWYDGVNLSIQVNNGTVDQTAFSADVNAGAKEFRIGADQGGTPINGLVDEVGVWKVALTGTQLTNLYNAGAGQTFPFSGVP